MKYLSTIKIAIYIYMTSASKGWKNENSKLNIKTIHKIIKS